MNDSKRRQAMLAAVTIALSAWGLPIIFIAFAPAPAYAAAASRGEAPENPPLARLQIEIWPEFDRPAVLVILKGELAADVRLPAAVSLRIPASAGAPAAVAAAAGPSAKLFNVKYDSVRSGNFIALKFRAPERVFHVEFYDPLSTSTPERSYTYVWPGDFQADRLSVTLQEPATASDVSVQPNLDATASGQDGLRYRSAELGVLPAGKEIPVKVRYTKATSQTSAEITKHKAADPLALETSPSGEGGPGWVALIAAAGALFVGGTVAWLWWRRRSRASPQPASGAGLCSQCGNRLASGDRFCSKCGARLT